MYTVLYEKSFGMRFASKKLCLFWVLLFAFCSPKPPDENPNVDIVLEINGTTYSNTAFSFYLGQNYPEIHSSDDSEILSHAFDQFKREIILAELANYSGYFVSEDQVDDFIDNKLTTMSFNLMSQQDRHYWRSIIKRRLAIQELLRNDILKSIQVGDAAIQNYYQKHLEEYRGESLYQVRMVQVPDQDTAKELLKTLKKSKEPFTKTVAPLAANEGFKIAQSFPISGLIPPFQDAVRKMRPGQYSKPIAVKQGDITVYYVLYLVAVIPAKETSYEEARYDIQGKIRKAEAEKIINSQVDHFLERLPVKVHSQNLPFQYVDATQRNSHP